MNLMKMSLSKMSVHTRRMLVLYRFLKRNKKRVDKHFYMGSWFLAATSSSKVGDCGTTACLAGWATSCPSLSRQGLKLIPYRLDKGSLVAFEVTYQGFVSFEACRAFFGSSRPFEPSYNSAMRDHEAALAYLKDTIIERLEEGV